jgi:hypothetical protein
VPLEGKSKLQQSRTEQKDAVTRSLSYPITAEKNPGAVNLIQTLFRQSRMIASLRPALHQK